MTDDAQNARDSPEPAVGIRYHGNPGPLFEALSEAQGDYEDLELSGQNTHKDYSYAKLEDLLAAVKPALREHGLCLTQHVCDGPDGDRVLRTVLGHEDGALIESTAKLPEVELHGDSSGGVHAMGSAITYMRRYAIQSVLGVSAETDDDGQRAQKAARSSGANPGGSGQKQGGTDKRYVFHPYNGLTDSQKDRLEKMGWNKDDEGGHWWGYFGPQEISRNLDALEKIGEVTEGGGS